MVKSMSDKINAAKMKGVKKATPPGKHIDATEKRLIDNMKKSGLTYVDIGFLTGRGSEAIASSLAKEDFTATGSGQPQKITASDYKKLKNALDRLLKKANAEKQVTVDMIKAEAGVDASNRCVLDAFHADNFWFFKLKEKPILEEGDVKKRDQWVRDPEHAKRTATEWEEKPHAAIDNKKYQFMLNAPGRSHAARCGVRVALQQIGAEPQRHVVKPGKAMKFPAQGVTVTAAVIKGKVRMWEYTHGSWNGATAAAMYRGPLLKAMQKAFPTKPKKQSWVVLEDNDPAGYKSGKAKDAKAEVNIVTDDLPRRSPDLNILDYFIWNAVNRAMRKQERSFKKNFKETKSAFLARLRKTALGLPSALVAKAQRSMRRRCLAIKKAKGGLIKE